MALYRKWRPKGFADFVGQAHLVRTLRNAVAQNRTAHAYLFCGPRGTGKTTAAKILAKAVNCPAPNNGDPCNECESCRRITDGISLDVQEIDGASNRGIDEVRDLREKVKFAPAEGRYRVYIIDEVHMLTGEAFNALLKTLEEPPPQVIFVFATTEPHKLPATVLSRCQRFEFKRFSLTEIAGRLEEIAAAEGFQVESSALSLISAQANGGMRDAVGLLEQAAAHAGDLITQADVRDVLGLVDLDVYEKLAVAVRDHNPAAALDILGEVSAAGKDMIQFARGAAGLWRDLLLLATIPEIPPLTSLSPEGIDKWRDLANAISAESLLGAVELFTAAATEQKRTGEAALPLELALIKITTGLAADSDLEERVALLEEKVSALAQSGAARSVPGGGRSADSRTAKPAPQSENPPAARKEGTRGDKPSSASKAGQEWPRVLARLNECKRSLHALLDQHARVSGPVDQVLTLTFGGRIFADKVERERELLEQILAEVYGRPITVRCITEETPNERRAESPAGNDPVAETIRIFDGTVEEE